MRMSDVALTSRQESPRRVGGRSGCDTFLEFGTLVEKREGHSLAELHADAGNLSLPPAVRSRCYRGAKFRD
jgi:hypothetical protein